jgi:predicted transposase/invertase (TIGR01784 family)
LEEKIETAKNMLSEGLDIKMISHITGLSISEIEKL